VDVAPRIARLELDRIGAGLVGGADHGERGLDRARMVLTDLGHDQAGLVVTDHPVRAERDQLHTSYNPSSKVHWKRSSTMRREIGVKYCSYAGGSSVRFRCGTDSRSRAPPLPPPTAAASAVSISSRRTSTTFSGMRPSTASHHR